jgi:hypothetical protein
MRTLDDPMHTLYATPEGAGVIAGVLLSAARKESYQNHRVGAEGILSGNQAKRRSGDGIVVFGNSEVAKEGADSPSTITD